MLSTQPVDFMMREHVSIFIGLHSTRYTYVRPLHMLYSELNTPILTSVYYTDIQSPVYYADITCAIYNAEKVY